MRREIWKSLRLGVSAVLTGGLLGLSGASSAAAQTAPGFCAAQAELFSVRAVKGLHRVVKEGPNTIKIEPLGLKAVCTFSGGERPARFESAEDVLLAARKPDDAWMSQYGPLLGASAAVSYNDIRPAPLSNDPFYYVNLFGDAAIVSIGVHADPASTASVVGNCFIERPLPDEALGVLLLTSASVYFEPDDSLEACPAD